MLYGVNNARRAGRERGGPRAKRTEHELVTCVSVESVLEWLPVYPILQLCKCLYPRLPRPWRGRLTVFYIKFLLRIGSQADLEFCSTIFLPPPRLGRHLSADSRIVTSVEGDAACFL